jgi:hypothetical protein
MAPNQSTTKSQPMAKPEPAGPEPDWSWTRPLAQSGRRCHGSSRVEEEARLSIGTMARL